jgi:hypothetical protein
MKKNCCRLGIAVDQAKRKPDSEPKIRNDPRTAKSSPMARCGRFAVDISMAH